MMRTYIRIELSSEGESPKQVIERMRKIGAVPVVGDYDFELSLGDDERIFDRLEQIHHALRGSSVRYTVTTRTDAEDKSIEGNRHQVIHYVDQKPVELKKAVYKAKIERWREMGLDVAELEILLERDLDKFKEASKEYLRTHLDSLSVISDKRPPDNRIDGEILALLDENGKTLSEIEFATGYFEDQITFSLGRLISAGSATRVQRDSAEVFCLVPPPELKVRKALEMVPAKDDFESQTRIVDIIPKDGISSRDLMRTARLPREQFVKAIEVLTKKGEIRVVRKDKKETFYRR